MRRHLWVLVAAGVVAGVIISGRFGVRAQDRAAKPDAAPPAGQFEGAERSIKTDLPGVQDQPYKAPAPANAAPSTGSVQDALVRPYEFPFARPTSLATVCAHLGQTLKAPVVLDRAALDRKNVEPESTVALELKGVRLKTGLKLLLDQVGLTYRVVPDDNLLIITDKEGSEDPAELIWNELRALHRDLHAVQDAVDDLRDLFEDEVGDGPRVHKPTIIEEMPENGREPGRAVEPPALEKPGDDARKRQGTQAPAPAAKPAPSRVPLAGPSRRL